MGERSLSDDMIKCIQTSFIGKMDYIGLIG